MIGSTGKPLVRGILVLEISNQCQGSTYTYHTSKLREQSCKEASS